MMNQVLLTGKLGADPEVLKTKNEGAKVSRLSIALNEYRFDEEGGIYEKVRTSWIPVTAFGELAEKISESLKSGDQVTIIGSLRSSSFEREGEKIKRLQVIARSILKSENLPMTNEAASEMIKKNMGESLKADAEKTRFDKKGATQQPKSPFGTKPVLKPQEKSQRPIPQPKGALR